MGLHSSLHGDPTNPMGAAESWVNFSFAVVSVVFVALRFWARIKIKSVGIDDWLILPALLFYIAYVVAIFGMRENVPGAMPTSLDSTKWSLRWFLVNECMMIWSAIFMKFSLAFFFLRLVVLPWQRYFLYGSMAVTLLGNIFFFFFCLFVCGNPLNYWENFVANYCWSSEVKVASSFVHNILNCIADLMLATMPFFLLRGSSMMWRMKLGVSAILGLATIGCLASIVRLGFIHRVAQWDKFYSIMSMLGVIGGIELGTGLVASSAACLKPLFKSESRTNSPVPFQKDPQNNIRYSPQAHAFAPNSTASPTLRGSATDGRSANSSCELKHYKDTASIDIEALEYPGRLNSHERMATPPLPPSVRSFGSAWTADEAKMLANSRDPKHFV